MKFLLLLVNFALLVAASASAAGNQSLPSIRARITQRGLNYAAKLIVDFITKNPHKLTMPEIPVSAGFNTMTVSNMVVRNLPRPLLRLFLIPANNSGESGSDNNFGDRLQVNITHLNPIADASLKIAQNWRFYTTERTVNITAYLRNMELSLTLSLGIDDAGRPLPSNITCHSTGDFSFELTGDFRRWNWFVTSIYNSMKSLFRETIFNQICENILIEVNRFIDNDLKTVPMTAVFDKNYSFDFRLLAVPKISQNFLETSHKGVVQSLMDMQQPELHVPNIPEYPLQVGKMVYAYITDSAVNSAWFAALANGHLNLTINEHMENLPETAKRYLNTTCPGSTCIGTMFPHLSLNYPNSIATVEIRAVNTSYPPVKFRGRSVVLRAKGVADIYIQTAETYNKIFSISLTMGCTVELNVSSQKLYFSIQPSTVRADADILSTPVNLVALVPVMEPILDAQLMLLTSFVILPAVQVIGNQGLPIQVPNVPDLQFVNPIILDLRTQHVLAVGTDVDYIVPRVE